MPSTALILLMASLSPAASAAPCAVPPDGVDNLPALPPLAEPLPEGELCNRLTDTFLAAGHLLDLAPTDAARADVLGNLARRLLAYGFTDPAHAAFREAWRVDPAGFRPPLLLAVIEESRGRTREALEYAEAARPLAPEHPPLLALLARLRLLAGEWESAAAAAEEALDLDPGLPHAHWTLAEVALHRDDSDAVLRHAAAALELEPQADLLYGLRAAALTRLQRTEEAADAARLAGTRAPVLSGPWIESVRQLSFRPLSNLRLGLGALRRRQLAAASAALDRALIEDPANADALLAQGRTQRLLGDSQAAVGFLRRAVAAESRFEGWVELGGSLQDAGATAEAVAAYRAALALRPEDKMARFWLAECLEREGNLEEALELLEALIAEGFGPSGPLLAADIAHRSGRPTRARELLEQSLKRFPAHPDLARALQRLHPPDPESGAGDGPGRP